MSSVVMKFGGTSVGDGRAINKAAGIILQENRNWQRNCVVLSAMSGVTDLLISAAYDAAAGRRERYHQTLAELESKHTRTVESLLGSVEAPEVTRYIQSELRHLERFCDSVEVLGEITPRGLDAVSNLGESLAVAIFSALLREGGLPARAVDAARLIVTDAAFQNAVPDLELTCRQTQANLEPLYQEGVLPVVTGFKGATPDGLTTTLGRGGSDYSAAILADCLDARELWIWTDVDGVMTADPRLIPSAQTIPQLTYQELSELAYFGAKVVHPRTIRPVISKGIPILVKNTFNPDHPGTLISPDEELVPSTVKAITAIRDVCLVNVEGRGMLGVPGIAARTFQAVASQGASVLMITQASSEQSIAFVIPADSVGAVVQALEAEMELELSRQDIDQIWSRDQVVVLTVVGRGLRDTPGIGAAVFSALAASGVNVIAVAQGSSESSLSLVVDGKDTELAVKSIHDGVLIRSQGGEP